MCLHGHSVVRDVFKRVKSPKLKGYIVWVPMILTDNGISADAEASAFSSDARLLLLWNENKSIGRAFAKTLDLRCSAWDVYMVYAPGKTWDEQQPPKPDFWMHQLSKGQGADPSLTLKQEILEEQISKMVADKQTASAK